MPDSTYDVPDSTYDDSDSTCSDSDSSYDEQYGDDRLIRGGDALLLAQVR